MFSYLSVIFVLGNEYFSPDYSYQYSLEAGKRSICVATSSSLVVLLEANATELVMLSKDFSELFRYSFEGRNKYEVVNMQVGSEIHIVLNLYYNGDAVPGLVSESYPGIGTVNGLYVAFDFQGFIVKSRWVDLCSESDSKVVNYVVKSRDYITVKNQCKNGSVCVVGSQGEDPLCFASEFKQVLVAEDNNGQAYFALVQDMHTEVMRVADGKTLVQIQKELINFQVDLDLFLVFNDRVSKYSLDGNAVKSFQLPVLDSIQTAFVKDSLFLAFGMETGFIDFNPPQPSLVLIQLNSSLDLINYRGFLFASPLQAFSKFSSEFYFLAQSQLYKSEDPFSLSSIQNCKNLTRNILGQAFCYSCQTDFMLVANRCIQDFVCPSNSIKDLNSLTCVSCYEGCSGCLSSSFDSCLSCQPSYSLFESQCLINCPKGYFAKDSLCQQCSFDCLTCIQDTCLACSSLYLYQGNCVLECPSNYKPVGQVCELCDNSNCQDCNSSPCNTCSTGYFLHSGKCSKCPDHCETCESKSVCSTCTSNYQLESGSCVLITNCSQPNSTNCTECLPGYFLNPIQLCESCPDHCETCDQTSCFACSPGYSLANNTCTSQHPEFCESYQNSSCFSCVPGYELQNNTCVKCPENCSACVQSACLSCHSGYLHQHKCIQTCPKAYEAQSNSCQPCPDNCQVCSQGLCTECLTNYTANGYFVLKNSACQEFECFSGYENSPSGCTKVKSVLLSYFKSILSLTNLK